MTTSSKICAQNVLEVTHPFKNADLDRLPLVVPQPWKFTYRQQEVDHELRHAIANRNARLKISNTRYGKMDAGLPAETESHTSMVWYLMPMTDVQENGPGFRNMCRCNLIIEFFLYHAVSVTSLEYYVLFCYQFW